MSNLKEQMQLRTLIIAKHTIEYCKSLPKGQEIGNIKSQLIRSVSSVGANYHAACRAKSKADFIYKLQIVEEECDESIFWMKLLRELSYGNNSTFNFIFEELNEILSIIVSSLKTLKSNN